MKNKLPTSSLIVATYNWPSALRVCLKSILSQTLLPDEVIIADDGSTEETALLIKEFQHHFPVPLIHVWQPDEGFQLARIRNKGIAKSSKEYIIQVDGDLILHNRFVEDHLRFSKPGSFVTGSRVIMDADLSQQIIQSGRTTVSVFKKGIKNKSNGMRVPLISWLMQNMRKNKIYNLRGCNMAFWKSDLQTVNGYNENFNGWGREDSELVARLFNSGVKKRTLKFGGIAFHLFHNENARGQLEANERLLMKTLEEKIVVSPKGIRELDTGY